MNIDIIAETFRKKVYFWRTRLKDDTAEQSIQEEACSSQVPPSNEVNTAGQIWGRQHPSPEDHEPLTGVKLSTIAQGGGGTFLGDREAQAHFPHEDLLGGRGVDPVPTTPPAFPRMRIVDPHDGDEAKRNMLADLHNGGFRITAVDAACSIERHLMGSPHTDEELQKLLRKEIGRMIHDLEDLTMFLERGGTLPTF